MADTIVETVVGDIAAPATASVTKKRGRPKKLTTVTPSVPKKRGQPKSTTPKPKPEHPKVSVMVTEIISSLQERGGTSLKTLKKEIIERYKDVDAEKLGSLLRKCLNAACETGHLVRVKGSGANGSFQLAVPGKGAAAEKKRIAMKATPSKAKIAALSRKHKF